MNSHEYIFFASIAIFALLLGYIFIEHQYSITNNESMIEIFEKAGLTKDKIEEISHDDFMWYYRGKSTCVLYNNSDEKCLEHEGYCSGDNILIQLSKNNEINLARDAKFGTLFQQAVEVRKAIEHGGYHPSCPLIYQR